MANSDAPLSAEKIIRELKKAGVTHIVYLPDDESRCLCDVLRRHPELTLVPICREGEAIAIAAGLLFGGKSPVVWHQSTGFYESGDSVRGLALDLGLPLAIIIDCRGWKSNAPMTDSAAIFIQPILNAWGIRYHMVETDDDIARISLALNEARTAHKPVAVLLGRKLA